jgi:hypothetical protein
MEILIPGLVLVGFMIWASTRIKRNAAKAFEREEIEAPEYTLTKPEGFLALVDPPDGLLFSAYSRDFGSDAAERLRRATIQLRRFPDAHFDEITERAKIDSSHVISEHTGIIGGRKCANILVERLEQGVALESHYKIIAGSRAVYQLVVSVLPEYKDEFQPRLDEILAGFLLT